MLLEEEEEEGGGGVVLALDLDLDRGFRVVWVEGFGGSGSSVKIPICYYW